MTSIAGAGSLATARTACKRLIRTAVPLAVRKRAVLALHRQTWINERRRNWWSVELVRDLADSDVEAYHRFLWTNHLGYAESYEASVRFGPENLKLSRKFFFADLCEQLPQLGLTPPGIRSVFEVGCSLGYQLRYMETDLFPQATRLDGIDIDRHAIQTGAEYLKQAGSRVALQCADTKDLEPILADRTYDVIVCAGVLMYLNEDAAADAVLTMLRQGRLVALAGLAHPSLDNAVLHTSDVRSNDATFIHNFDRMVTQAGGRILARRWEGSRNVDGNTIYFVFATHA